MVYGAGSRVRRVSPNVPKQLVPMDRLPPPLCQIPQQLEFPAGQIDYLVAPSCGHRLEIDDDASEPEEIDRVLRPTQHSANARDELLHVDRLGQVVVGAASESSQAVGPVGPGGKDDARRVSVRSNQSAQVEPTAPRQRDTQEHDI